MDEQKNTTDSLEQISCIDSSVTIYTSGYKKITITKSAEEVKTLAVKKNVHVLPDDGLGVTILLYSENDVLGQPYIFPHNPDYKNSEPEGFLEKLNDVLKFLGEMFRKIFCDPVWIVVYWLILSIFSVLTFLFLTLFGLG